MTRFARAKGSKASNERKPEEATSWSEMKRGMLLKNATKASEENLPKKEQNTSSISQTQTEWAPLGNSQSLLQPSYLKQSNTAVKPNNEESAKKNKKLNNEDTNSKRNMAGENKKALKKKSLNSEMLNSPVNEKQKQPPPKKPDSLDVKKLNKKKKKLLGKANKAGTAANDVINKENNSVKNKNNKPENSTQPDNNKVNSESLISVKEKKVKTNKTDLVGVEKKLNKKKLLGKAKKFQNLGNNSTTNENENNLLKKNENNRTEDLNKQFDNSSNKIKKNKKRKMSEGNQEDSEGVKRKKLVSEEVGEDVGNKNQKFSKFKDRNSNERWNKNERFDRNNRRPFDGKFNKNFKDRKNFQNGDRRNFQNGGRRNFQNGDRRNFQNGDRRNFQNRNERRNFNQDSNSVIEEIIVNGEKVPVVKFQGFPVTQDDAERLKTLRMNMIKEGIPRDKLEAALKLERRRAEKALQRLKKAVCFHCRGSGHLLSNCPVLAENQNTSTGICYKCGSTEHSALECKVVKGTNFQFAECFICKEQGHIARQCPDNPRGLYPQGGACRECGDVTHLRKDCPKVVTKKTEDIMTVGVRNDRVLECLDEEIVKKEKESAKPIKKRAAVKF